MRIPVDPNQFVGIHFNQPIRDLKVQVGPIEVQVISLLQDFAAIGIPEELPAGIHDVILRSTNGVVTLAQAVEKVAEAYPPVPEHSPPPSGNPGEYRSIHLWNVEGNDEAQAYVNGQLVGTAHAGDDITIEIGEYSAYPLSQDQRNEIRFELENRGGGYTYGFKLCTSQGRCYYDDVQGKPDIYNVHSPDGTEDTRTGVVYSETMHVNRFGRPMGRSDQPIWYKVFNLAPQYEYRLSNYRGWEQLFPVGGELGKEYTGILPTPDFADTENSAGYYFEGSCKVYSETWGGFTTVLSNEAAGSSDNTPKVYGLEIYRGIHLLSRQVMGHARRPEISWGSSYFNASIFEQAFTSYPNVYPPPDRTWNDWWRCQ